MPSVLRVVLFVSTLLALVNAQGVILSAQGTKGSPASLALQVNTSDASDANIIKVSEVSANIVNECGRTLLAGNSMYQFSHSILSERESQVLTYRS